MKRSPLSLRLLYWLMDLLTRDYPPRDWHDGAWRRVDAFPVRTTEENSERMIHAQEVGR